ncbi:MAG TPA: preprotein translocase subunit SecY [Smithella sp.]|nr:preprotein translocase subunit SecY [Smithella sp.]OQC53044.1 MAG: preprotein translocase subunit SecY [Deltaproteobacteria bacterium ADurb.Bin022]HNQ65000.1 preprotein translocase subunit SecY [Smithella sp.]HOE32842.1 preprotein translocase subunit SecY [Smithella sp.]HOG09125.1 preprotein translocase subunit SecY [Smithella sp.]
MLEGLGSVSKIPELQRRILFTILLLGVYRIGVYIPTPGIDNVALLAYFEHAKGSLFGLMDMFAGGAFSNFSIFALGIMPYISSSIILQLLTIAVPHLERLSKEGESGRRKITQYTRYGTVLLSMIQGFGIAFGLQQMAGPSGAPIVLNPGIGFVLMTMITLTSGTAFIMWLGEVITEKGIGNGISLIIFAGIVCRIPAAIGNTFRLATAGELGVLVILLITVLMIAVVGAIVFVEGGQRRIPVQYAKRVVGRKMYGGQTTHLPLKVNTSGVIPPIFASSVIMFPATIANFAPQTWMKDIAAYLVPGRLAYEVLYVAFIFFFCFFYTAVTFKPDDVAENMKKYGGYVPGIRPGKKTAEYIENVLEKLTFSGAIYVSIICVLPSVLIAQLNVPFYFGGTALLIVVGVAMDTASQIESHLLTRQYEGFMKKGHIARRR